MPDRYKGPPTGTLPLSALSSAGASPTGPPPMADSRQLAPQSTYYDPTTGYYTNGQAYFSKNSDGSFTQLHNLDMGSQVARALASAGAYAGKADTNNNQFNTAFTHEMSLADMLNNTIQNQNAPSVAAEQEKQSLQANQATQLSQASGVGGQNAFLARHDAGNNMAALGAQDAQTGALRRAQEVQGAENTLGSVLGTAASGAAGMYGANTGLGLNYSQLGMTGENYGDTNATNRRGQNVDIVKSGTTAAGSAGSAAITASDRRLKHDIQEEPASNEDHFMSALSGKSFEYNDDSDEDPERHGILTEQLKKSKIGRSLVRTDDSGYEGFDVGQGLGAALSALGYLHRKVAELEKERR